MFQTIRIREYDRFSIAVEILLNASVQYPSARSDGEQDTWYPYIGMLVSLRQLFATAISILQYGGTAAERAENEALASLLHDLVRRMNGGTALLRIREELGDDVAEITLQCAALTERDEAGSWEDRKRQLLARFRTAPDSAKYIEAASRLQFLWGTICEYRMIHDKLWKTRKGGREGTLWFNRAFLVTLKETVSGEHWQRLLAGFEEGVCELERLVGQFEGETL